MRWDFYTKGLIIVAAIAFFVACSPKSNYTALSFFFDGVPNPYIIDSLARVDSINLVEKTNISLEVVETATTQLVLHPPYQEKECESCHDKGSMGKLTEPMPQLCYQCHEDYKDQYEVLHGPVDAGYCTECHNPHMNKNEYLLRRTGQELCLFCHMTVDVFKNEVHADIEDANCTECHNPHGGDDRFIIN